uniref:ATP synthase complex subunit 8 n=1 Tax=Serrognathus platymelus TaxID=618622 RepID=A0A514AC20_9SCAR|nr:ATP synthase F0 subunit 8 [Serrognathus platymelus]QDH52463.1 ATP synthase F0 subunit 8 [Serrognathus platymelus]
MPQMAPLNWLTLMIIFSLILIMMTILNYSILHKTPKSLLINKLQSNKTWKW